MHESNHPTTNNPTSTSNQVMNTLYLNNSNNSYNPSCAYSNMPPPPNPEPVDDESNQSGDFVTANQEGNNGSNFNNYLPDGQSRTDGSNSSSSQSQYFSLERASDSSQPIGHASDLGQNEISSLSPPQNPGSDGGHSNQSSDFFTANSQTSTSKIIQSRTDGGNPNLPWFNQESSISSSNTPDIQKGQDQCSPQIPTVTNPPTEVGHSDSSGDNSGSFKQGQPKELITKPGTSGSILSQDGKDCPNQNNLPACAYNNPASTSHGHTQPSQVNHASVGTSSPDAGYNSFTQAPAAEGQPNPLRSPYEAGNSHFFHSTPNGQGMTPTAVASSPAVGPSGYSPFIAGYKSPINNKGNNRFSPYSVRPRNREQSPAIPLTVRIALLSAQCFQMGKIPEYVQYQKQASMIESNRYQQLCQNMPSAAGNTNLFYDFHHGQLLDQLEMNLQGLGSMHMQGQGALNFPTFNIKSQVYNIHQNPGPLDNIRPSFDAHNAQIPFPAGGADMLETSLRASADRHNSTPSSSNTDKSGTRYSSYASTSPTEIPQSILNALAKASSSNEEYNNGTPVITQFAIRVMTKWYERNHQWPYPKSHTCAIITEETGITLDQVKKWFGNKRQRDGNTRSSLTEIAQLRKEKARAGLTAQQEDELLRQDIMEIKNGKQND